MFRFTGYVAVIGLLLALGASALGADDCAAGPAAELVRRSTFTHGYLHGYEAGFHAGDVDFHAARVRTPRQLREIDRPVGYQPEFGSRESFRSGFHEGFLAGYEDSIAGRDFRGFQIVAAFANSDPAFPKDFDLGVVEGYKTGQRVGIEDLEADADFNPEQAACPAKPDRDGRRPAYADAYCSGYVSAYRLGYRDGFLRATPAPAATVVAAQ